MSSIRTRLTKLERKSAGSSLLIFIEGGLPPYCDDAQHRLAPDEAWAKWWADDCITPPRPGETYEAWHQRWQRDVQAARPLTLAICKVPPADTFPRHA